ncbi:MAG: ATP-binding protein [Myxococcaceae bacterium]
MIDLKENFGYLRSSYLSEVERYFEKDIIKVIVGIRRSGKSILMKQMMAHFIQEQKMFETEVLYVDKEDLLFDFLKNYEDLNRYVDAKKPKYLFIDEVQEIENWEKAIASFHKKGIDVYITGSNAKMLSSDLATHLSGRYVSIPIYTLSFREFIEFNQKSEVDPSVVFADYLKIGGFPLLSQFTGNQQACYTLIGDIFETIVLKDIVSRHQIRRVALLGNIIRYVADNVGNTFSANKISDYLKSQRIKIDVETVQDYLGFLTSTFALHKVRRYDVHGKRHLEISEKYYLGDLGLRHALIGYHSESIGQFLENIVYLELLRRGYHVSVGKLGNREIDFIAEKGSQKIYVQVCYLLATPEVFSREFGVLGEVRDQYPKLVLSMDTDSYGNSFDGIERKNIVSWLLEEI